MRAAALSCPFVALSMEKGKAYPLRYSGLENSMDCMVHEVAKSRTQLSNFHITFTKKGEAKAFLLPLWLRW